MFGTGADKNLKMKGHESYGFLLFLLDTLDSLSDKVPKASTMLDCGQQLVTIVETIKREPKTLTMKGYQDRGRRVGREPPLKFPRHAK